MKVCCVRIQNKCELFLVIIKTEINIYKFILINMIKTLMVLEVQLSHDNCTLIFYTEMISSSFILL